MYKPEIDEKKSIGVPSPWRNYLKDWRGDEDS
jgi:hypothetical protein